MSCYRVLWLFVLTRCCLSLPAATRNSSVAAFPIDTKVSSTGVSNVPGVFALVDAPDIAGVHALVGSLLDSAVAGDLAVADALLLL